MRVIETHLSGLFVIEPTVYRDDRGWFYESWNQTRFDELVGRTVRFVQDNHSRSSRGTMRGLHYQIPTAQGKLVRCTAGAVWDVAVDLRESSSTCGEWFGTELSAENMKMLWVPEGFAHGFVALRDGSELLYKATAPYRPDDERTLRFDDPVLGISWPVEIDVSLVSSKDRAGATFADADLYE